MQYSVVGMIGLGRLELNIQWWNDWISQIEIEYSVDAMIRLGRSESDIQWME
jgi:hypothetical protein